MASVNIPTFAEWFDAQSLRKDLVGSLARLHLSAKLPQIEFAVWLREIENGGLMTSTLANAELEYDACIAALKISGHSPTYRRSIRHVTRPDAHASFDRHVGEPEISIAAYRKQLRRALGAYMLTQKRLYLDTNHWIRLQDVELGRCAPEHAVYRDVLKELRRLRAADFLVCPISFPLFLELMGQSDLTTRLATADLMDELSGGIGMRSPSEIERIELKADMLRAVLGPKAPNTLNLVWTKIGAIFGEFSIKLDDPRISKGQQLAFQKAAFDEIWGMPLAAYADFEREVPLDFIQKMTDAYNRRAAEYRQRTFTFEEVFAEEKASFARMLIKAEFEGIAREIWGVYPAECAAIAAKEKANVGAHQNRQPDPAALASIQIRAGIYASFITQTTTMKAKKNDLIDALHAALSLNYTDAICVDKALAHRLKSPPLKFGAIYPARVFTSGSELGDWLSEL